MCKYELLRHGFRKLLSDRRQTDSTEIIYHTSRVVNEYSYYYNQIAIYTTFYMLPALGIGQCYFTTPCHPVTFGEHIRSPVARFFGDGKLRRETDQEN